MKRNQGCTSKMAQNRVAKTLQINDVKIEDVPVLSKIPTQNEIKIFQKWILKMGKTVGLDFNEVTEADHDRSLEFWLQIQPAFFADVDIDLLLDIFTGEITDVHEIPEATQRKKPRSFAATSRFVLIPDITL